MASDDNWDIDPSDDDFLRRQGANQRERVLAAGFLDGVSPARIGKVAGYGSGKSNDPEKQRQNWSAAVSRAAKRGGQVITRIQVLIDALKHFRTHGEAPKVCDEHEVREKLSNVIRSGADPQVVSAGKAILESYRRDGGQEQLSPEKVVAATVAHAGLEKARIGIEALCPNLLHFLNEIDTEKVQATALHALNSASAEFEVINERMDKLEVERKQAGAQA